MHRHTHTHTLTHTRTHACVHYILCCPNLRCFSWTLAVPVRSWLRCRVRICQPPSVTLYPTRVSTFCRPTLQVCWKCAGMYMHSHSLLTPSPTHRHKHKQTQTDTNRHKQTHRHSHRHSHTHTHTHSLTYTHTHSLTHSLTRSLTHTHTDTHTHTHSLTHSHTPSHLDCTLPQSLFHFPWSSTLPPLLPPSFSSAAGRMLDFMLRGTARPWTASQETVSVFQDVTGDATLSTSTVARILTHLHDL